MHHRYKKKKKIRLLFIILLCVLAFGRSKAQRFPNIIILYTIDHGYGDLSCYNDSSAYYTPNIDRIAQRGIRFTDAHSPSTICSLLRYAPQSDQRIYGSTGKGDETFSGSGCNDYLKTGTPSIAEIF
jgi:arylsulfatase A-like enzyme